MKIYAVREAGTYKFHGVFWARNMDDLWDAVDEMADPVFYEYAEITRPSGVWHDMPNGETVVTPQIRLGGDDDDNDNDNDNDVDHHFHPLTNSGELFGVDMLFLMDHHRWTRFDAANEGVGMVARAMREAGRDGG